MNDILQDKMNDALESFGAKAECTRAERHRHLAFFDIRLRDGYRVRRLEWHSREIALSLQTQGEPIITTIPRLGVVRLKVALEEAETLRLNDLFKEHAEPAGILPFLIGETDEGKPLWLDMATNPHMLVAGATSSGKSTLLHVLVENALRRNDVDLFLVDPKQGVEFSRYASEAMMITSTYDETIAMLENIRQLMETRYVEMRKLGVNSIEAQPETFTKKLIIVDEAADLMMWDSDKTNPKKGQLEKLIASIAQKARAAGIYMVLATQRPSVDVLTGLIKTNFPARLACKVTSHQDSKVILDRTGAETLMGRGDAILNTGKHNYVRFQVAYVDPVRIVR